MEDALHVTKQAYNKGRTRPTREGHIGGTQWLNKKKKNFIVEK